MKIKFYAFFILFVLKTNLWSQNYFIAFLDKPSCNQEESKLLLSNKALQRRTNQKINLDSTDCPVHKAYLDSIKSYEINPIYVSKWMNGVLVNTPNQALIESLKSKSYIAYIHDLQASALGGIQSFDSNFYGKSWNSIDFLGIQNFHNKFNLGEGIEIAIFDGGFNGCQTMSAFEHLFSQNKIIETYNFVENTKNVYKSIMHGTNVLSLISAQKENEFIGIAPNAKIALYLTEDATNESIAEEYYWLFAAEKADSAGIDIINSSLGYYDFDFPNTNHTFNELDGKTSVISKAAKLVSKKGVLVVNSSGNSNNSTWPYINFPADVEEVLTVGSINEDLTVSSFSSRGPINNTYLKPELVTKGVGVEVLNTNGNAIPQSGTSFCAPIISGLCALIWSENPDFSAQELKQYLISNASNFNSPNNQLGYGYPSFKTTTNIWPEFSKNVLKIEYFDLNGRFLSEEPIIQGLYIKKTIFEDNSVSLEKTFKN